LGIGFILSYFFFPGVFLFFLFFGIPVCKRGPAGEETFLPFLLFIIVVFISFWRDVGSKPFAPFDTLPQKPKAFIAGDLKGLRSAHQILRAN
jgi:hypothetical protein